MSDYILGTNEPFIATVDQVLTAAECAEHIAKAESLGFQCATINTGQGTRVVESVRNNRRVIIDDWTTARLLYDRVRTVLPAIVRRRVPVGANEKLRYYRYEPGQWFALHQDFSYVRDRYEQSFLTLLVYLNDDYTGGETYFRETDRLVIPKRGMALIFEHSLEHEGNTVQSGVKYALRSDIMYRINPAK